MPTSRTRSEYLLRLPGAYPLAANDGELFVSRAVKPDDREELATLLLDAYRGTIDDEDEGPEEALAAIDEYFSIIEWQHSKVLESGPTGDGSWWARDSPRHEGRDVGPGRTGQPVSLAFVVVVDRRHYVDPVVTATAVKGHGLGTAAVRAALASLATAGVTEVGAVITNGNVASERLFAALGFRRIGPWPR